MKIFSFVIFIFIVYATFTLTPDKALAKEISQAGASAAISQLSEQSFPQASDVRLIKLKLYLQKLNSPLAEISDNLIAAADIYNLPWTLVPAISGVESGFCRNIPDFSYNCWGWNNGKSRFGSFFEGVFIVSKTLRSTYFDRGLTTVELIAPVYAPPSKTWASKVRFFMRKIEEMPVPIPALQITI